MARRGKRNQRAQNNGPQQIGVEQAFAAAVKHMRAGQYEQAEGICLKILGTDPLHLGAMHLRGSIAFRAGHAEAAIKIMKQIIAFKPDHDHAHNDVGMMLHQLGRFGEAEMHLKKALELAPKMAGAHLNLGNVYRSAGQLSSAEKSYNRAIRIKPDLIEAYGNLSLAQLQMGRAEDAAKTARKGIKIKSRYAIVHSRLASALDRQGQFDAAVAEHKKAIELQPDLISVYMDYAYTLAGNGDMEESKAQYREVLKFASDYVPAYGSLARMDKFTSYDDDIKNMEALANRKEMSGPDKLTLAFSLGKAFEDIGEYKKAFEHLKIGNALHRQSFRYSVVANDALFADIKNAFNSDLFKANAEAGDPDETPIFVLGMPRSGTSLVEQILSSHPEVFGAGELSLMNAIAGQVVDNPAEPVFSETLARIKAEDFADLGREYMRQLRTFSKDSRFITDKMPGNSLYVGLIKLILPNAKIVHCRRSPADTCLSIFKTYFSSGGLHYAYDLEELGRYYKNYENLMAHWRETLPGFVYDLDYELLVADQREQTEKLLEWCGLDWSDDCMSFFKTRRTVSTASIAQVRQPVYKSSMQLWRKYGAILNPLLEILNDK